MHIEKNEICPLPWVQVSILPDGKVRLCCHSKSSNINELSDSNPLYIQKNSLSEILNSRWLSNVKKEFLEGNVPESCTYCFSSQSHHSDNPAKYFRERFQLPVDEVSQELPRIRYLDISLTRICNLQCLMCSPNFSTALESLYGKKSTQEMPKKPFDLSFIQSPEFEFLVKDLQTILFQGGEPFLSPLHIPVLKKLVKEGRSSNITLNYITNGTVPPGDEVLDLWESFFNVNIEVSLDDVGERAEYIRYPLKWEKFEAIFYQLSELSKSRKINLDTVLTYQALNIFSIPRVFHFLKKCNVISRIPVINILEHPRFLIYRWLPAEVKQSAIRGLEDLLSFNELNDLEATRLAFITKKLLEEGTDDISGLKSDFVIHLKRMNALRGRHGHKIKDIFDYISK